MMKRRRRESHRVFLLIALAAFVPSAIAQVAAPLPGGIKPNRDLTRAWRQTTPSRERISANGLWRWQPAEETDAVVPAENWGYFKVPGAWPGITDYLQKDSQTVFAHASWKNRSLSTLKAAWYQREIQIPPDWAGRKIAVSIDTLNSLATVYVDGAKAGDVAYPSGEIDLSALCRPGRTHVMSLHVVAQPMAKVMVSYADTAAAKNVNATVARRGLCGDVYLVATPAHARLANVAAETSVRRSELTLRASFDDLAPGASFALRARVLRGGKQVAEFKSEPFTRSGMGDSPFTFTVRWKPDQLWDLHTPQNVFDLETSLLDADGNAIDTAFPTRLGFRELWIDGRDFYLNGTRLFLCALPIDSAQIGAGQANYAAARRTLERLKSLGINLVYTHNYDTDPGAHLGFEEILRAADDVGMLVSFTLPHFSHYEWKPDRADATNGYARHAAAYVRYARNHPSVVFYSMSHNATGYEQDMNPDLIDGLHDPRETWSANNAKLALRAEAIARALDPSRIVYHHAGGNIGAMYTINFYPNFAPAQELSDWFTHWSEAGVKPLFLCEYGAPFTWDWTMYRGWYDGKREFGSAAVPWEFCLAEWNAQFLGDRSFALSEPEKANLRWEDVQYRAGKLWHRWDYPTEVGSPRFEGRNQIMGAYLADNWRAYRTLGVSGISPWEYAMFFTPRPGIDRARKSLPVDWDDLQRPGFSPDYADRQVERIDTAFEFADWVPTAAGEALLRNNQPVLAYIAGKPGAFTGRDHNLLPGQTLEKQLILINNSRQTLIFNCDWSLGLNPPVTGVQTITVNTGQQARIPLRFHLPPNLAPGTYTLRAAARFNDQTQTDVFPIHVLPRPPAPKPTSTVSLFDPPGHTADLLTKLGIPFNRVDAGATLKQSDTLVIGQLALTTADPAPDVSAVREGLKVIVFEQSPEVLEQRLGFRIAQYGLRQVFPRIPRHPLLAGLTVDHLQNWAGESTTLPPQLAYMLRPQHGPTIQWAGIPVSQIWRAGNRGTVASALIEKPAIGDFLPIVDGGFSLQYAPLIEFHEGKGLVLFCQLDVTARTEPDPTAETLVSNLFGYADIWKPAPKRTPLYLGNAVAKACLDSAGIHADRYEGQSLAAARHLLILAPGCRDSLATHAAPISKFLTEGGHVLALALDAETLGAIPTMKLATRQSEHLSAAFDPPAADSPLVSVGPADLLTRTPLTLPLVTAGASVVGDGVLALAPADSPAPNVIVCQLAPWQFDYSNSYNLKRSYRRSAFLLARLLANQGVAADTPLLDRFHTPPAPNKKRFLDGLYTDTPQEWDDPYRFFRW